MKTGQHGILSQHYHRLQAQHGYQSQLTSTAKKSISKHRLKFKNGQNTLRDGTGAAERIQATSQKVL